jgi:hypothetical protein
MAIKTVCGGRRLFVLLFLLTVHCSLSTANASTQQEVHITGQVQPFGGYRFTEAVSFEITGPGKQEIGRITVEGLYNGEYPWILRVYTDNLHFFGIGGALRTSSPAGLVSQDGQFTLPLFIQTPNSGEDEWRRIPDAGEPGYLPYAPQPEPGETAYTDCVVLGIDPRNGSWVAGPDRRLYTGDDNFLGDLTVQTPFEMVLQAHVAPSAVRAQYETTLYFEIVAAP